MLNISYCGSLGEVSICELGTEASVSCNRARLLEVGEIYSGTFLVLRAFSDAESFEWNKAYLDERLYVAMVRSIACASKADMSVIKAKILGFFYSDGGKTEFSGGKVSTHDFDRLIAFLPDEQVLHLVVNGLAKSIDLFKLGRFQPDDCSARVALQSSPFLCSAHDFVARRTAVFGKTRNGKSNTIKVLIQSIRNSLAESSLNVGQLVFDINGEYANKNSQDGNYVISDVNEGLSEVLYLADRAYIGSGSLLRFNFYERPTESFAVMARLVSPEIAQMHSIVRLFGLFLPDIEGLEYSGPDSLHGIRKILIYWVILAKAGLSYDEERLGKLVSDFRIGYFSGVFSPDVRRIAYQSITRTSAPHHIETFSDFIREVVIIAHFRFRYENDPSLRDEQGELFDPDEDILLDFLISNNGNNPILLKDIERFHAPLEYDYNERIIRCLEEGKIVILDLSGASPQLIRYFVSDVCTAIFSHQEGKFNADLLGSDYIQVYFEEAHNVFPVNASSNDGQVNIYSRYAKEGAKFNIGMVFATQSPLSIQEDLLYQTENYLVGYLSSALELDKLSEVNSAFSSIAEQMLNCHGVGYIRVLTSSNRYVIPVKVRLYEDLARETMADEL